ncbi:PE2R3 protein, partial [Campylorhamphus procurvoides]|nr:PE2R3 protein [Campylorhamphus procurvoides]
LLGQLLTAPIVIAVYLSGGAWEALDPSGRLCAFFGGSMTAFGLCPLLTASAMAAERALAARAPHWYASRVSARAARRALLAIWAAALGLALLPLLGVGKYTLQWPGTWCFIGTPSPIPGRSKPSPTWPWALPGLGTIVLLGSQHCQLNQGLQPPGSGTATASVGTVRCGDAQPPSPHHVSLLPPASPQITMLKMSWGHTFEHCRVVPTPAPGSAAPGECSFFLTAVRLASLNQILDPWVYLLLRKILLQRFCQAASAVSKCSNTECKQRSITLSEEIRRTA